MFTKKPYQRRDYEDRNLGCHVNPVPFGCLECPLQTCLHDDVLLYRSRSVQAHDLQVADARLTMEETMLRFNLQRRTVFRILARVRKNYPGHQAGVETCGCGCGDVRNEG